MFWFEGPARRLEKSRPPEAGLDAEPRIPEKSRPPLAAVVDEEAGAGAALGLVRKKARRSPLATPASERVLVGGAKILPYFVTTKSPSSSKRALPRSKTSWTVKLLGTGMLSERPVDGSCRVMVISLILLFLIVVVVVYSALDCFFRRPFFSLLDVDLFLD